MHLTEEQITAIQIATVEQKDSELWHTMRKGRLTASNFGTVLLAKRVTPSLISKVCQSKHLEGVLSIQWGIANEQEGINAFEKQTGMKVINLCFLPKLHVHINMQVLTPEVDNWSYIINNLLFGQVGMSFVR